MSSSANPNLGVVKIFAGPVHNIPENWMLCQGQLLEISKYQDLFNLIKNTYGGDGATNFNLPNMQCCAVFGTGQLNGSGTIMRLGETGGSATTSLNIETMAQHSHSASVTQPSAVVNVSPSNSDAHAAAPGSSIGTPGATVGRSFSSTLGFNGKVPNTNLSNSSITIGIVNVQNEPSGGRPAPFDTQPPYLGLYYMICVQ